MFRLINLFFHLGLHIGTFNKYVSTSMYTYLLGHRYSRTIFNVKFSILCIRRISLFLLLVSKLNNTVLPVLRGFELPSKVDDSTTSKVSSICFARKKHLLSRMIRAKRVRKILYFLRIIGKKMNCHIPHKSYVRKKVGTHKYVKKLYLKNIATLYRLAKKRTSKDYNVYRICRPSASDVAVQLFYRFDFPVLLNTIGLINNWTTYYSIVQSTFSEAIPKYSNRLPFNASFAVERANMRQDFVKSCIAFVLCMYYKLNLNVELNIINYKFRMDRLVHKFRKFYVFIKFLTYLRAFTQLPSTLFYLDPYKSELSALRKFRICTLSLIDSDCNTSKYITYPVPSSFSTYLSRIFYAYLFINAYFFGRILLILDSIV